MNSDRHSPRRRNMSRSPHYSRNNSEYNERSVSPHRRYSSGRRSSSTSPHNHVSYKTQYRSGQDSDYSDGGHSRNSRRSYSSSSEYEYFGSREKDRDYDHSRDRDRDRDREWDRERSRSREYRDRERHHHKDRDYDSHHRERFRREKNRDRRSNKETRRSRDRDRDRSYRENDRDSNEGRDRSPLNSGTSSGFDSGFYKNQPPNNTIMIRGLAQHITENDVRQDIINCGLMPKDIRLIRKKDTGASRGFAFVEFTTLQEATRWMEMKQVSEPQMEEKRPVAIVHYK